MNSQKADNDLNLALDAREEERERSLNLNVGYDREDRTWELIVKYSGSLERIASDAMQVTKLSNEYAILRVRESLVETLAALPEIEYMEKPHRLYFQRENGKRVSCVNPVQRTPLSLHRKGVLIAVLDSGVVIPIRISEGRWYDPDTGILGSDRYRNFNGWMGYSQQSFHRMGFIRG